MLSAENYNALLKFRSGPIGGKMDSRMRYFRDQEYIEPNSYRAEGTPDDLYINPTSWRLTPRGDDALAEYEQVMKNHSEENAQQKKSRIFEIFLVLLGAVIGYLIDHISNIISWIVSLF